MHQGFWPDAAERALRAVIGSGVLASVADGLDHWLADGQAIDWNHYLGAVVLAVLGSLTASVAASRIGDGSARIGTTHPVTPDGIGGREMTHDEAEAITANGSHPSAS